jgi:hypothetical protein
VSTAEDTAAIVAWKEASSERVRSSLLAALFRAKHGLVRALTFKAARIEKSTVDDDELMQAGFIGFKRALEGFRPELGYSIATYAWGWIRHEVQSVTRSEKVIALPRIRLKNDERAMVVAAIQDDPDVDPETLGVHRTQFEQVRSSFGLRFVSDAVPSGALALERCMHGSVDMFDAEEDLDRRRRLRLVESTLHAIRAGATQEQSGLSAEGYAAALEFIRIEEKTIMTETQAEANTIPTPAPARGKWSPERRAAHAKAMGAARKAKGASPAEKVRTVRRSAATEVHKAAPNRFEVRLAQLEAERKVLELLATLDADVVGRVLETLKTAA